jgi:predicted peptidase
MIVSVLLVGSVAAMANPALTRSAALALDARIQAPHMASRSSQPNVPRPVVTPTPRPPLLPVPAGTFATRVYTDQSGNSMTYYLYGPSSYTPSGSYPLILVLHGGGEVAELNYSAQKNRDVLVSQPYVQAFTSAAVQQTWPSFVVAPQVPAGQRWVNVPASVSSYTLASTPSRSLGLAIGIVQSLLVTYPMIDPNRIYVTGISMGGFGAWEAAERWPDLFAAAVPIAGAGDPQAAAALVHVPIWALHGSADAVVPVLGSRLMVQAARAAGGMACYTEFPGAGHGVWSIENLDNPALLTWLFSRTKAPSSLAQPLACPSGS